MQETPRGSRLHIAIFGRRNAGKSSLINALTNQDIALVSPIAGTTTDPVAKAMEILPVGPVLITDTAGLDDVGELGELRVARTKKVLDTCDVAIIVIDATTECGEFEQELIIDIKRRNVPLLGVINKIDMVNNPADMARQASKLLGVDFIPVSVQSRDGIDKLKAEIINKAPADWEGPPIIGDLIAKGDIVILVVPIDSAAPKGRLILPQVQTLRDILDNDGLALTVKQDRLKEALDKMVDKPKLVVTDSQVFKEVAQVVPDGVSLTSFSILFARHKGDLETFVTGAKAIGSLKPGDKVLIAEACTHHQQKDDIGTVKIPCWLNKATGGELDYTWVSGTKFPDDLAEYKLVVHCGGCMISRREMLYRLSVVEQSKVPVVNYGVLIAYINGILGRTLTPFPKVKLLISK